MQGSEGKRKGEAKGARKIQVAAVRGRRKSDGEGECRRARPRERLE